MKVFNYAYNAYVSEVFFQLTSIQSNEDSRIFSWQSEITCHTPLTHSTDGFANASCNTIHSRQLEMNSVS